MGKNLTISQKGLILVSVPLLFQLAFLALVFWMQLENTEAQTWANRSKEVLTQAHAVLGSMVDVQTGVRGWVLTDDPVFAEPFERAIREVTGQLGELRSLVQDPSQKVRADRLEGKAVEILAWYAEVARLMRDGQRGEAVARVKTGEGKRRMDELRGVMATFLEEQKRIDTAREHTLEQSRQGLNWLLLIGGLAAFLTTGALSMVFSRGISTRLAGLGENVQRLSRGEGLAPSLEGSDEVTSLDRAFHDMADELTRSREALRDQMQILHSILESMGDGVIVTDRAGRFLVFNPAAARLFGKGKTAASPGEWSQEYGLFLPDRRTPFPADQLPLVRAARGEAIDDVEMFICHSGAPHGIWTTVTGRPLGGHNGDLRGGVIVCRDITERKRSEEAIQRMNQELEKRVAERTAELAEANRDLVHKNQENEMFVYSVSHDLRSPLVNLQGFSKELDKACQALTTLFADEPIPQAIRERGLTLLHGKMAKSLGFIQTSVLRLSGIIDALLRLSRAGRIEHRWERVDVTRLVERVIGATQGTITERGVRVTIGELPPAMGDRTALEQVFANLVGNALTYLDPARPGEIDIGCLPPGADGVPEGFRTYYVRDNGLGIAEAHQAKIFQVFQRAHPHIGKGEGMGLAIVSRIAERHRGRAWVESQVGAGSTFYVTLPTAEVEDKN